MWGVNEEDVVAVCAVLVLVLVLVLVPGKTVGRRAEDACAGNAGKSDRCL